MLLQQCNALGEFSHSFLVLRTPRDSDAPQSMMTVGAHAALDHCSSLVLLCSSIPGVWVCRGGRGGKAGLNSCEPVSEHYVHAV